MKKQVVGNYRWQKTSGFLLIFDWGNNEQGAIIIMRGTKAVCDWQSDWHCDWSHWNDQNDFSWQVDRCDWTSRYKCLHHLPQDKQEVIGAGWGGGGNHCVSLVWWVYLEIMTNLKSHSCVPSVVLGCGMSKWGATLTITLLSGLLAILRLHSTSSLKRKLVFPTASIIWKCNKTASRSYIDHVAIAYSSVPYIPTLSERSLGSRGLDIVIILHSS